MVVLSQVAGHRSCLERHRVLLERNLHPRPLVHRLHARLDSPQARHTAPLGPKIAKHASMFRRMQGGVAALFAAAMTLTVLG